MSRLDDLMKQLCPNGVEYKKLNEISEMKRGTSVTKKDVTEGSIPVISGGKEPAYYCDTYNRDGETITVAGSGAGAGYVQYWNEPIFVCDAFSIKGHEGILTKYLYYCLTNMQEYIYSTKKGGGVPHVHISSIENVKLPVPPQEVQREIVHILDSFTFLSAELTAELTARKKQYEFYRDKMLTHNADIPKINMSELCESIADGDHNPPPKSDRGIPFITISNIMENKQIDFSNTMFVPDEYYDGLDAKRKAQKDDILYTVVGSFGTPVYIEKDMKFVFQRHIAILRPKQSIVKARYLYHAMQSSDFYKQADIMARGAAQRTISLSSLGKMSIYVPTLEVQEKIIEVLDNFEAICNDFKIGLPAEIEARKKQYEYYRDMLLTFPECSNTILTDRQTDRQSLIKLLQYVYGVAVVTLSDIVNVFRGEYITKKGTVEGNIPVILGGQEPAYYINRSNHSGEIVVIARSGASAGFVSYWNEDIFVTDGFGYEAEEEFVSSKYLYYALKNKEKEFNAMKRGAGVPHVSGEALLNTILFLPTKDEQQRIVNILDQFNNLCNDLAIGLPAEIEARRRQYEYYRDKLLTFKELSE